MGIEYIRISVGWMQLNIWMLVRCILKINVCTIIITTTSAIKTTTPTTANAASTTKVSA